MYECYLKGRPKFSPWNTVNTNKFPISAFIAFIFIVVKCDLITTYPQFFIWTSYGLQVIRLQR